MLNLQGRRLFYEDNGDAIEIGAISMDREGSYAFWPKGYVGYYSAIVLRPIADMLDDMNRVDPPLSRED